MIEREEIRFVAAADWTDDCRVRVELRKRVMNLTLTEARAFLAEFAAALGEAEHAFGELHREVVPAAIDRLSSAYAIHPECAAGKCGNCDGETMAADDSMVPCEHPCHWETITPEAPAVPAVFDREGGAR